MIDDFCPVHRRLDLAGADRLTTVLMQAFEIGVRVDLAKPRGALLQSLGPSLEHLSQDLRGEIGKLPGSSHPSQLGRSDLRDTLERLIGEVGKLIDAVRAEAAADQIHP
jgi:hypothetical protein